MYFYFSSSFPSAIKFNGIYYGVIHDTVKVCNFEDGFIPFVEVCPLDKSSTGLNFLPNDSFLSAPPDGVLVTDMRGGYLLQFPYRCAISDFKIIAQQKFNEFMVTVYSEYGIKISIESKTDFYLETLNARTTEVDIIRFSLSGTNFVALNFNGENLLSVYEIGEKISKVFSREVASFNLENGFTTTEVFKDMAKHKVVTDWTFENGAFCSHLKTVTCDQNFKVEKLPLSLIPFAFLEDLLVGANVNDYLSDNIKENADKLIGYLGKYIGVMPPPLFRNIDEVGLIFQDGKNKYQVDYCAFQIENKKITNVKKLDS